MSVRGAGACEAETGRARARPLSSASVSGVWSLLSWLRGPDQDDDDDSASSASGASDRTATSFAFLPPSQFVHQHRPLPLPLAWEPPTDTYRKRLYDGHVRRQYERDAALTLHRKYLLPLGEQRYDASSLPPARRSGGGGGAGGGEAERDRRATSESLRRAHVPGKRRAPLPPRRRTDKRPAPPPPLPSTDDTATVPSAQKDIKITEQKEDQELKMSARGEATPTESPKSDTLTDGAGKSNTKDAKVKIRQDKSFLKQIFESRAKRNSSAEVPPVKLLPSISELDRQAAELLESYKLKVVEQNNNISSVGVNSSRTTSGDKWFCTRCLKKYDATMVTCLDCLSEAKVSSDSSKYKDSCLALKHSETQTNTEKNNGPSSSNNLEEKEKLKEILKEMKHSLPKRPKPDTNGIAKSNFYFKTETNNSVNNARETPTLPMGSSIHKHNGLESKPTTSQLNNNVTVCVEKYKKVNNSPIVISPIRPTENVVITQTTVLMNSAPPRSDEGNKQTQNNNDDSRPSKNEIVENKILPKSSNEIAEQEKNKNEIKISTLLNQVYVPKNTVETKENNPSNISLKESFLHPTNSKAFIAPVVSTSNFTCLTKSVEETKASSSYTTSHNASPSHVQSINKALVPGKVSNELSTKKKTQEISIPSSSQNIPCKQVTSDALAGTSNVNPLSSSVSVPSTSLAADTANVASGAKECSQLSIVDQHSKRRVFITQLEKSIASGDEKAAAEAAIKLAQLRLSCSVLSFSSQIISEAMKSTSPIKSVLNTTGGTPDETVQINEPAGKSTFKVDSATQSVGTRCLKTNLKSNTTITDDNKVNDHTKHEPVINKAEYNVPHNDLATSNTTVPTSKPSTSKDNEDIVTVEVWVEDRSAARGAVRLRVRRAGSLGSLRREAEARLGLPAHLQRWIVGRALCSRDDIPLLDLAGPALDAPFYLCLVESETTKETSPVGSQSETNSATIPEDPSPQVSAAPSAGEVYSELVRLERQALVANTFEFECSVCLEACAVGAGGVLRECAHAFCRGCLAGSVLHGGEAGGAGARCPAPGCHARLQEREARAVLTRDQQERRLATGLRAAESASPHAFHCRTRDCAGWALCDPPAPRVFLCPVCGATNCVPCKAIHAGETCEEYRKRLEEIPDATKAPEEWVKSLVRRGEALECPECGTVISKQWGCDWVRCAACRTEICWATRGRRWGPAGKGDVSAGCRCGVDGKRCHPSCGYCH